MNISQIIGLCLLAPFSIFVIVTVGVLIIEEIKKNPIDATVCIAVIMAIIGFVLLYCG